MKTRTALSSALLAAFLCATSGAHADTVIIVHAPDADALRVHKENHEAGHLTLHASAVTMLPFAAFQIGIGAIVGGEYHLSSRASVTLDGGYLALLPMSRTRVIEGGTTTRDSSGTTIPAFAGIDYCLKSVDDGLCASGQVGPVWTSGTTDDRISPNDGLPFTLKSSYSSLRAGANFALGYRILFGELRANVLVLDMSRPSDSAAFMFSGGVRFSAL